MTDEQTSAAIVSEHRKSQHLTITEAYKELKAAIVRALQAARKEGGKQVVDEAERVSQILQSANTANADNESKARFEVERFMFASAGSAVGKTLTDYQKHALFHLFKNVFDSHESALRQAARTPPPGHIIDDAGVVRRVLGEIPVTDDGCVVGKFAKVWVVSHGGTQIKQVQLDDPRKGWVMSPKCYSTPKAAEAAKEGKA